MNPIYHTASDERPGGYKRPGDMRGWKKRPGDMRGWKPSITDFSEKKLGAVTSRMANMARKCVNWFVSGLNCGS